MTRRPKPRTRKGLRCPECKAATRAVRSKAVWCGSAIRRRRACVSCDHRFNTTERID